MSGDSPVPASREEVLWATLLRALASQQTRLAKAERAAAYWESEAVLRASTVANDMALRLKDAEIEQRRLRRRVRAVLASDNSDVAALRAQLARIAYEDSSS